MADEIKEEQGTVRSNQKLKIMYLMKILMEESDEDHGVSMQDIITKLAAYDVTAERRSLYRDIEQLRVFGLDIKGYEDSDRQFYYKLVGREFEPSELKLLVDAVQCSKFITTKQSKELIDKLKSYVSKFQAAKMQRQVYVNGRIKSSNERSYYSVDSIYDAIDNDKKISFYYFFYDQDKKKQYKHDKKLYVVSPFAMCWDDEKYYLVAYDETDEKPGIKHFRVDKMERTKISDQARIGKKDFAAYNMADYTSRMFGMFNEEVKRVDLLCDNNMANVIIDRFGMDVKMLPVDDGHFKSTVTVAVSNLFLSWIMAIGGVKILGPDDVVEKMKDLLKEQNNMYQ